MTDPLISRDRLLAINEQLHPLAQSLANATALLCQSTGRGRAPRSVGSAVLLRIGGSPYLFTASHVFDNAEPGKAVYAALGGQFVSLARERWRTRPGTSGLDRVDLAIVPLNLDAGKTTGDARFLELHEIDPFLNSLDPLPRTGYMAIGYPHTKQPRYLRDGQYQAFAHHFLTHYEPIIPGNKIGADPQLHITVGFDAEDFTGADGGGPLPKPVGMSGGGLWRIPDALSAQSPQGQLVGVIIEHYGPPHHVIVATRLANPLHALAERNQAARRAIVDRFPIALNGQGA